jgi:hypothetical protein
MTLPYAYFERKHAKRGCGNPSKKGYYGCVNYSKLYHDLNDAWLEKRVAFDSSEVAYLANKDTFKGKRLGFLTHAYYQREKLIRNSEIYLAYVFQSWSNAVSEKDDTYPTWMLFSPERALNENPAILKDIVAKVQSIRDVKVTEKNEKTLQNYLKEYLSDVSYFVIPDSYSLGHFVYLSIVYLPAQRVSFFHLGVNLILANPSFSKEVLYLPEKYWPSDYKTDYDAGKLVI